jgi:hypothetical protein
MTYEENVTLRRMAMVGHAVRAVMRTGLHGLVSLLLLGVATSADAGPQEFELEPLEETLIDLSGDPQDADDTALRIKNLSANPGLVSIEFDPKAGLGPSDSVASGFALLDGTLIVSSDIPPGELRARYRVEADARALGRAGIRADGARMLRRDVRSGRWRPAIRALEGRADVRYLRDARADFELGHHGFSEDAQYVWAVIDVNSRYAAGGRVASSVSLFGPLALVGLGVALLVTAVRTRRSE